MKTPAWEITTCSALETLALGRRVGALARPGLVLALYGDLGAGKTVFVQGLARGLGVPEKCPVTSPTFTLINEYPGRLRLFHIDLYRISDLVELDDIGFQEVFSGEAVVAVEWAERCSEALPEDRIDVRIRDTGPESRLFSFSLCGQLQGDLLKALENER